MKHHADKPPRGYLAKITFENSDLGSTFIEAECGAARGEGQVNAPAPALAAARPALPHSAETGS